MATYLNRMATGCEHTSARSKMVQDDHAGPEASAWRAPFGRHSGSSQSASTACFWLAYMSVPPITSVVTDSVTTFWVNGQPYSYQWFNWRRFRTYLSTRYGLDDFWCWFYWLWFTVISEDGNMVFHNLTGEMHLLLIVLSRDLRVIQVQ